MYIRAVEGSPGLYRCDQTGQLINGRDFIPWETSDRFEGVKLRLPLLETRALLVGWSLSCAKEPRLVEMQQTVMLSHFDRGVIATALVKTALTTKILFPFGLMIQLLAEAPTEAVLQETPIEGAGLRLHLHGYIRRRLVP
jgi:hypothetical protein